MIIRDRYRPEKTLEHSPMAEVFLAEDLETGQMVVIRRLADHLDISSDILAAVEGDAAKLRSLNLPTIAAYEDIFYHEGSLHLVRAYLPGPPLDMYLAEHGPLSNAQAREWALSLARTFSAVHVEEVIHGDLRPNNIYVVPKRAYPVMAAPKEEPETEAEDEESLPSGDPFSLSNVRPITRPVEVPEPDPMGMAPPPEPHEADTPGDYRLIVTNFSTYRLMENRRLVTTTARLNVSNFTSPQRWQGQRTSISDDIWSLGVLFFQLSSGRLPFEANNDAAIMNRVLHQMTPNLRGRVPRGMVAIVEHLLEKDPWRRYRSVGAVVSDLERGSVRWPGRRSGLMPRERNPVVSWVVFGIFLLLLLAIPAGGGAALVAGNLPTLTPIQVAGVIISPTPTDTATPVILPFVADQGSPTASPIPSATWTPIVITNTPSNTPTATTTPTITPTATITPTSTATNTATPTGTATSTATATGTATPTAQPTATASASPTASATPTASASPTPSATTTPTSTATPTATLNMTATQDYAAFLTRSAVIQSTQAALETRRAPTVTPDIEATNAVLTPAAATLRPNFTARTSSSALPLCEAGETFVSFTDFSSLTGLPGTLPAGFLQENIGRDAALHLTRTGTWALPIPAASYTRLQFDLLAPRALTPPLTISFLPVGTTPNPTGWRLTWTLGDDPESTGLLLEQVRGGEPETVSSLVAVPFDEWVTVEMGFQPLGTLRSVFILNVYAADGEARTALLVIENDELTQFGALAINATVDSAPWLDNLLVCQQPGGPAAPTATPGN